MGKEEKKIVVKWDRYKSELLEKLKGNEIKIDELMVSYMAEAVWDSSVVCSDRYNEQVIVTTKLRYLAQSMTLMSNAVKELNELLLYGLK